MKSIRYHHKPMLLAFLLGASCAFTATAESETVKAFEMLKRAHTNGLLSAEEYEAKRKALVNKTYGIKPPPIQPPEETKKKTTQTDTGTTGESMYTTAIEAFKKKWEADAAVAEGEFSYSGATKLSHGPSHCDVTASFILSADKSHVRHLTVALSNLNVATSSDHNRTPDSIVHLMNDTYNVTDGSVDIGILHQGEEIGKLTLNGVGGEKAQGNIMCTYIHEVNDKPGPGPLSLSFKGKVKVNLGTAPITVEVVNKDALPKPPIPTPVTAQEDAPPPPPEPTAEEKQPAEKAEKNELEKEAVAPPAPVPAIQELPITIQAYGNNYTINSFDVSIADNGNTTITAKGSGFSIMPFRAGNLILPVECSFVATDGSEHEHGGANMGGTEAKFNFKTPKKPKTVTLYAGDDKTKKFTFNVDGGADEAVKDKLAPAQEPAPVTAKAEGDKPIQAQEPTPKPEPKPDTQIPQPIAGKASNGVFEIVQIETDSVTFKAVEESKLYAVSMSAEGQTFEGKEITNITGNFRPSHFGVNCTPGSKLWMSAHPKESSSPTFIIPQDTVIKVYSFETPEGFKPENIKILTQKDTPEMVYNVPTASWEKPAPVVEEKAPDALQPEPPKPEPPNPEPPKPEPPQPKPLPLPASGEVFGEKPDNAIAPFEIKTSGKDNYFVKLADAATGKQALAVFVRGGDTVNLKVPLGTYEIRYASGKDWFGEEHLFGDDTRCTKADTVARFQRLPNGISGCSITLYTVRDGNLSTTPIPRGSF